VDESLKDFPRLDTREDLDESMESVFFQVKGYTRV